MMVNNQSAMEKQPETAMALLGMMLKKMPMQLLKSLPVTLLIGVLGFLINFWLMAYVNDGFNPGTWTSKNLIPVTGMMVSAVVLWGILGAMSTMVLRFLLKGGNPATAMTGFFRQPGVILNSLQQGNNRFKGMLCFGVAATLLAGVLLSGVSSIVTGLMLMSSLGAVLTDRTSVLITLIQMMARDISRYGKKQPSQAIKPLQVGVIVGSCGFSLLLIGFIRAFVGFVFIQILLNTVWVIFLILGLVLFFSGNAAPGHMMLLIFMGLGLLFHQLGITTVFADDGGRSEIGGNFWNYLNGQGAMEVIIRCIPPAIAAIFGSLLGSLFGSFAGTLGTIPGGLPGDGPLYTGTVEADLIYGSSDSLEGESQDDYEKRLLEYINSLDPRGAKTMRDPLTGTEYLVKYDPVTDTYFELNSKRVFSMDQFEDAQSGAEGLDDWRNRNAQLDKEYQAKMSQLDQLKNQIQNDADQMTDPAARSDLYNQINAINHIQTDFLSGRGELTVPPYEPPPAPVQPPPPVQPGPPPQGVEPPGSDIGRGAAAITGRNFDFNDPLGDGVPEAPAAPEPEIPAAPEPEIPAAPEPEIPAAPEPEIPAAPEPEIPAAPESEAPTPPEPEAPAPADKRSDSYNAGSGFIKFRDPEQNPFIDDP